MRIFYILNSRWPTIKAHGLQVAKTCQGLQEAGADVHLIVPRRHLHAQVVGSDPFELYGIHTRFPVTRLPSLDITRGALFFVIQQTLFALVAGMYVLFRPGVIYTRDPFTAFLMTFTGKKVFWEAHRFPARPRSIVYRWLFRATSGIVVITHGLKKLFMAHGMSADRVTVIADAVDPDEFSIPQSPEEARAVLGLPSHGPIIGYVGHLTTFGESKGVEDLMSAFAIVHQKNPEALLLIVGGSQSDLKPYQRLATELDLGESVIFTGHQPHAKVPLYLRAADVLVMPYPNTEHYAHYMSPLKLFEYMAAGKPIITTDLPSVREVVGDDDVFFSLPGNIDQLSDVMTLVLHHPDVAQEKVISTSHLIHRYSWDVRGQQILSFISRT